MKRKTIQILAGLLLFLAPQVIGQDWEAPAEAAAIENPLDYTLENVKSGRSIYILNCKSCHGDPGKNNPLALVPLPVDIASESMQANSEGALFYKITSGKGVMPPFENTLSEEERWMLINFVKNFSPDREALWIDAPPIKAKLLASVNQEKAMVEIMAESETKKNEYQNLPGAVVTISAKKTFGNIEIGQAITNESGRAEFVIPENLIGDEEGYVSIVVSLDDSFEAKKVTLEKALIGNPKVSSKLIRPEILWSTNEFAPKWLVITYILTVLGAWIVIGYVIFKIIRISSYGKSSEK